MMVPPPPSLPPAAPPLSAAVATPQQFSLLETWLKLKPIGPGNMDMIIGGQDSVHR